MILSFKSSEYLKLNFHIVGLLSERLQTNRIYVKTSLANLLVLHYLNCF